MDDKLHIYERAARHRERTKGLAALLRAAGYNDAILSANEIRGVARIAADIAEDADEIFEDTRPEGGEELEPKSATGELSNAIDRFKTARAAVKAHICPPDIPPDLTVAEWEAVEALALAPCASAAELIDKLRLLLEFERGATLGGEFEISRDGSLPIALEAFFATEARA